MKRTTLIIFSLIALASAAAAIAWHLYTKPVSGIADAQVSYTMPSAQLFNEFESDQAQAGAKYVGQVLAVEGEVADVLINQDSSYTLVLSSDHPIFGVKCRLDPHITAKQSLPEIGSEVSLKGKCTGMNADVELNQCILLNTSNQ